MLKFLYQIFPKEYHGIGEGSVIYEYFLEQKILFAQFLTVLVIKMKKKELSIFDAS